MHASQAWITMFRRIPQAMHDGLTIGLRSGSEIAIQTVLKLEPEFAILRGRLTGTQEGGKVLLIPYAEMTVLSILRPLKDPEVEEIFGKGDPPTLVEMPAASATPAPAPSETPVAAEPAPANAAPAAKKSDTVSKAAMLAKLRERLKEHPGGK